MKIRAARERALINNAVNGNIKVNDLMSAILYVADSTTIKFLTDTLELEQEAKELQKQN